MKKPLTILLFLCSAAAWAQQPPATMTKMQVLLQNSDTPASSLAAKSKVLYRAGNLYCRVEEQADPEHGIHGLMILHEPDAWMVNLASKTALHIVDPGPTYHCRLPIFVGLGKEVPVDVATQLASLEFGQELEFFKSKGATAHPGPVLQTKQTTLYKLEFGDSTVALFTYGDPAVPLAVAWTRGDKHSIYWYSGYGQVPFDASLFAKPGGVVITEIKPDSGAATSK
ncbi:MAG TPA: hypothetical protein VFU68_03890 [Terracidiphilus sp.]|nr:hypothetical protein [Terracidiphilus sp.]